MIRFKDRGDAGRQLARALKEKYPELDGVVYPLPRGGVPLGVAVASAMNLPMDLIIPRKIGHPMSPEYAICAVSESGGTVCNERERALVDAAWLKKREDEERRESRRRRDAYVGGRKAELIEGRTAILVDDGIATGLTMRAAIRDARARHANRIIVAIPVVPADTAEVLGKEVDDVVALSVDKHYLGAVGAYYENFDQVSDEEVIAMMQEFGKS